MLCSEKLGLPSQNGRGTGFFYDISYQCAFSLAVLRLYKELSPATDCGRAFEFGERNILTEVLAKESKPKP